MREPQIITPSKIFEDSARYTAPVFQRLYVWGRREWDGFAEDLETTDVDLGQFLGAIVLKDLGRTSGPASPTTYLLIDGQQRLTTIYLLLVALAEQAYRNGGDDDATFIWRNYLAENKSPAFAGSPKLIPTLQDRAVFYEILQKALPGFDWNFKLDPPDGVMPQRSKLRDQWLRVSRYVSQYTGASASEYSKERMYELLSIVQQHQRLIVITLEQKDDANAIFSRLNAKGLDLELSDLVRNEIFSKFSPGEPKKAEEFFDKTWKSFEQSLPDDSINAFFPIYAHIALSGNVTKASAFSQLQSHWKSKKPDLIVRELEEYSRFVSSLSRFEYDKSISKVLNEQVERFSRMPRTRVTWPFLVQVLHAAANGDLSTNSALTCLRTVESFLVRRALRGLEPTGLHAVFKSLWEKTQGDPSALVKKIVTRTITCPSDDELIAFLKKEPSDTRAILPYFLQEFESHYVAAQKFDPVPLTKSTIEHILPKNFQKHWHRVISETEHHRTVRLLGNIAALSEKQNKSLKDQSWDQKRKRFRGSNFKSTQKIALKKTWDASQIDKRTAEMSQWAIGRWKQLD